MPTLPNPSLINRKAPTPGGPSGYLRSDIIGTPGADTSIGDALQGIGEEAHKFAMVEKARMDQVAVDDAQNQYIRKAIDLEAEYGEIKGKYAVDQDIVRDYTTKLDGISDEISSGLKNVDQKRAWDSYYGKSKVQFAAGVMKHKLNESDQYASETYKSTNSTRIQNAHSNWSDASVVNNSASDIVKNIAREKIRSGWGDERTEVELKSALGPLWSGVAAQYINARQYDIAKKILDQHKDVIGVDKYTSYNESIQARETRDLSKENAADIMTAIDNYPDRFKAARKISDTDISDATLVKLKKYQSEELLQDRVDKLKIKQARAEEENKIKYEIEKTKNDFLVQNNEGSLTADQVKNSNLPAFGLGSKNTFLNMISSSIKNFQSDPTVYNSLLTKAYKGEIINPDSVLDLAGVSLSSSHAEKIRNIAQKPKDQETKRTNNLISRARELGEKTLTKGGLLAANDADEQRRYYAFSNDFDSAIAFGIENGLTIDEMLNPRSPKYIVDSVLIPHIPSLDDEIAAQAAKFKADNREIDNAKISQDEYTKDVFKKAGINIEQEQAKKEIKQRKTGETIEEYLKRTSN